MGERPYVLVSCAVSLDGYLDDATPHRLLLSNEADFDRVDEVRAGCDAVLVGAATIRKDDPRLLVRSPDRRAARLARGEPATPVKVTLTGSGDLDPRAQFFTAGDVPKLVYVTRPALGEVRGRLGAFAEVVAIDAAPAGTLGWVLADLAGRGIRRLLVEGGGGVLTQVLVAGLADELHLVVAPVFVGDSRAPRFVRDGRFPWNPGHPARLAGMARIGDLVLLRYALSARFAEPDLGRPQPA